MRSFVLAFLVLTFAPTGFGASQPARAQSFFQQFFGSGAPVHSTWPAPHARAWRGASFATPGLTGLYRAYGRRGYAYQSYRRYTDAELGYDYGGRTYETMCVRTCDGYYWPISAAATRGQFHIDAAQCASSCDGEARLFYRPTLGEDPAAMTDLSGRAYAHLPNAFRYRKSLVDGCTCRPAPWSAEERERHRRYDWMLQASSDWRRDDVEAEPVAGSYRDVPPLPPPPIPGLIEGESGPGSAAWPEDDEAAASPAGAGSVLRPLPRKIFKLRSYTLREGSAGSAIGWFPGGLAKSRRPR